jgi:GPH family glycoside/pentoside/hexuronide:cation symporter
MSDEGTADDSSPTGTLEAGLLPITFKHKFGYALGGGGWVLLDRLILTWGLYCYRPPSDSAFPQRLTDWSFLGLLTVWGLANLSGRAVDSITDPLMASWTDRSRHPFGRRRIFMASAAVPLCVFTALLFFPPDETASTLNTMWVVVMLYGFFLSYTVYAVPYTAMVAELGRTPPIRLQLTTMQAAMQMVGAALVMIGAPLLELLFDKGNTDFFRAMGGVFGVLALFMLLGPVALIPEPKLCVPGPPSKESAFKSLFSALSNKQLRWFLLATVSYWFGFNVVAQAVPYYVTTLMGKEVSDAAIVLGILFGMSFLSFLFLGWGDRRFGKRRMMIFGSLSMAGLMFLIPFIHDWTAGLVLMGLAGVPVAIVMAVPNAMLAALAEEDAKRTGLKREAMVFATQAFFLKVNIGVSSAVVAALLLLGDSRANPLGVQLTAPAGGIVLVVSAFAYWRYRPPDEVELTG